VLCSCKNKPGSYANCSPIPSPSDAVNPIFVAPYSAPLLSSSTCPGVPQTRETHQALSVPQPVQNHVTGNPSNEYLTSEMSHRVILHQLYCHTYNKHKGKCSIETNPMMLYLVCLPLPFSPLFPLDETHSNLLLNPLSLHCLLTIVDPSLQIPSLSFAFSSRPTLDLSLFPCLSY
jgi:hypothetical protein